MCTGAVTHLCPPPTPVQALDALAEEGRLSEDEVVALGREHVQAFKFNNATVKAFRMGWWGGTLAFLRAAVALTPLRLWLGAAALLAALVAVRSLRG